VRQQDGSIFYFTSVADTSPEMHALVQWLTAHLEAMNPVQLATQLHYRFVRIHPFDDGNGRVARLLANYVLMRSGYLPAVVRTSEKAKYLAALRTADAGEMSALTEYFGELTQRSLEMGLKAARGQSIEELSDVEKEVELFIRDQHEYAGKVKVLSKEVVRDLYELGLKVFLETTIGKMRKLAPLFADLKIKADPGPPEFIHDPFATFEWLVEHIIQLPMYNITFRFRGYAGKASDTFSIDRTLGMQFEEFGYTLSWNGLLVVKKRYSEPLLGDEGQRIATDFLADIFTEVKSRANLPQ
jgi:hypothetical protein